MYWLQCLRLSINCYPDTQLLMLQLLHVKIFWIVQNKNLLLFYGVFQVVANPRVLEDTHKIQEKQTIFNSEIQMIYVVLFK